MKREDEERLIESLQYLKWKVDRAENMIYILGTVVVIILLVLWWAQTI